MMPASKNSVRFGALTFFVWKFGQGLPCTHLPPHGGPFLVPLHCRTKASWVSLPGGVLARAGMVRNLRQ